MKLEVKDFDICRLTTIGAGRGTRGHSWIAGLGIALLVALFASVGCSGGLPSDCAGLEKKMEDDVAAATKDPSSADPKEVDAIQKKMTDLNCPANINK